MIKDRLNSVWDRIRRAAARAGRNAPKFDIVLVCATKEASIEGTMEAIEAGATDIGENKVQEAASKYELLNGTSGVRWHLIGHLQTNKVKKAVRIFDLIHSIDSLRLAGEVQKEARKLGKVQGILVEVNVSGEKTKYGMAAPDLKGLVIAVREMKNLMLMGLMTMAPSSDNPEDSRPYFKRLRELRDSLSSYNCDNIEIKHLSMGMSGDFEVAIEEGADIVRIGSAIFK